MEHFFIPNTTSLIPQHINYATSEWIAFGVAAPTRCRSIKIPSRVKNDVPFRVKSVLAIVLKAVEYPHCPVAARLELELINRPKTIGTTFKGRAVQITSCIKGQATFRTLVGRYGPGAASSGAARSGLH